MVGPCWTYNTLAAPFSHILSVPSDAGQVCGESCHSALLWLNQKVLIGLIDGVGDDCDDY